MNTLFISLASRCKAATIKAAILIANRYCFRASRLGLIQLVLRCCPYILTIYPGLQQLKQQLWGMVLFLVLGGLENADSGKAFLFSAKRACGTVFVRCKACFLSHYRDYFQYFFYSSNGRKQKIYIAVINLGAASVPISIYVLSGFTESKFQIFLHDF